jgi:iron complex transport system permease protein
MKIRPFLFALLFLGLTVILSIAIGAVFIPPADIWRIFTGQAPQTVTQAATIILELRLPRTALVLLTGAALGTSGAAYQGLFRNPLADPYLIGVASGAGLGAVLAMNFHWPYTFWGLMAVPLAAFTGAFATVFIVYAMARIGKSVPSWRSI